MAAYVPAVTRAGAVTVSAGFLAAMLVPPRPIVTAAVCAAKGAVSDSVPRARG